MTKRIANNRIKFNRFGVDSQTGSCAYEITLDGREVGTIEKNAGWYGTGVGYRCEGYTVEIYPAYDDDAAEGVSQNFDVLYARPARTTLAEAKDFCRDNIRRMYSGAHDVTCPRCDGAGFGVHGKCRVCAGHGTLPGMAK